MARLGVESILEHARLDRRIVVESLEAVQVVAVGYSELADLFRDVRLHRAPRLHRLVVRLQRRMEDERVDAVRPQVF